MKWNNFNYGDVEYDLTHMHPFEWEYVAPAVPNKYPERAYNFHVVFSTHCFSRNPYVDENIDSGLYYSSPNEKRVFCFDRYEYSKDLPGIVRSFGERNCFHTHHNSFFTIELIGKDGEVLDYEVYFDVTRAKRKGNWFHLHIKSAYVRTTEYKTKQPRKRKIKFSTIAYNRLMNKPIKAQ